MKQRAKGLAKFKFATQRFRCIKVLLYIIILLLLG